VCIELSVFEHFGPYSAVDAASEVFDELAVDKPGNRRAGLASIDCHGNFSGRRRLTNAGQYYDCEKTNANKAHSKHIKPPFHFQFFSDG
jgi:hypothetical protein